VDLPVSAVVPVRAAGLTEFVSRQGAKIAKKTLSLGGLCALARNDLEFD
jgi:hypothetical protein